MLSDFRAALSSLLVIVLVSACANPQRVLDDESVRASKRDLEQSKQQSAGVAATPPADVAAALMPPLSLPQASAAGDRFDVSVADVPAREFFMSLVKGTRYNMVVHPDVNGTITLDLQDVTIDEVMNIVRSIYGYAFRQAGNVYQVMPNGLRTEVFKVDYLNVTRQGKSETRVSSGQVSDAGSSSSGSENATGSNSSSESDNSGDQGRSSVIGTRINTTAKADFWTELQASLQLLVGRDKGQQVIVTPQAGIVMVRAQADEIEAVRDFLTKAELVVRRQVIIEAKILEVQLNDGFQSGIDWSAVGKPSDGKTITVGNRADASNPAKIIMNPNDIGGVFSINAQLNDFTGLINLLQMQGTVQVLSSPRISTTNNQKAVIKVGTDEFFVTEVSSTTTAAVGSQPIVTPSVELTPFFSGIALDVTPQISESDEVVLHIHPSVSEVKDQTKSFTVSEQSFNLPLAFSSIRETDSIVFAKSGQVVVIGGLMQTGSNDNNAGTPFLQDVPFIGEFFKQRRQSSNKSELVILLKPVVMGGQDWQQSIDQSLQRFNELGDRMGAQ